MSPVEQSTGLFVFLAFGACSSRVACLKEVAEVARYRLARFLYQAKQQGQRGDQPPNLSVKGRRAKDGVAGWGEDDQEQQRHLHADANEQQGIAGQRK